MEKVRLKKLGIWVFAFSLFVFHLLFRSAAHADSSSWTQVFAEGGKCSISFPTKPQQIQQSLPLADGINRLQYDVYLAPHEDKGVFLLLVATYPMPISGGNEIAGLEGLLKGILNHHPNNELVYAELIDLMGKPAMDFLVEGTSSYFRGQAVMIENQLYLIAMEGILGKTDEKMYQKFLNTFKMKAPSK